MPRGYPLPSHFQPKTHHVYFQLLQKKPLFDPKMLYKMGGSILAALQIIRMLVASYPTFKTNPKQSAQYSSFYLQYPPYTYQSLTQPSKALFAALLPRSFAG